MSPGQSTKPSPHSQPPDQHEDTQRKSILIEDLAVLRNAVGANPIDRIELRKPPNDDATPPAKFPDAARIRRSPSVAFHSAACDLTKSRAPILRAKPPN